MMNNLQQQLTYGINACWLEKKMHIEHVLNWSRNCNDDSGQRRQIMHLSKLTKQVGARGGDFDEGKGSSPLNGWN